MRRASLVALTLAGGAWVHGAAAQVVAESTLTATISQSIEADTNYDLDVDSPGTTYFGDSRIGIGVVQQSETQQLRFNLSTGLRPIKEPEQDFEWNLASPSAARFAFAQDFANNAFDIDVGARVQRVDRLIEDEFLFVDEPGIPGIPDDVPAVPEDVPLIRDDTLERRLDLKSGFTAGTNAPSSVTFRLRASDVDYSGDSAEDLTPRTGAEADALWRLRFSPVLSSAVLGSYSYEESDSEENPQLQEAEVDLGLIYQPRDELSLTVGAGYANRQRRETDPVTDERVTIDDDSGISLRAVAQYQAEERAFGLNLRYTTAAPSPRLSGSLNASFQQLRGVISAQLFQDFGFGAAADEDERRVTGLRLGYDYSINEASSVGVNLRATSSVAAEDEDGTDDDRSQVDLTAQYSRNITALVDASLGYQLRQRFEDDPGDATSHRVFFQIARSFVTGF